MAAHDEIKMVRYGNASLANFFNSLNGCSDYENGLYISVE